MKIAEFQDWGMIRYQESWKRQEFLFQHVIDKKLEARKNNTEKTSQHCGYVVFCEHHHVITIGKSGKESNLLLNEQKLVAKGIDFHRIDRGGDITYHGPGQIVGYPIIDLEIAGLTVKSYVHSLEQSIIDTLLFYGISADRLEGATGVWVDVKKPSVRKICAIGIKASRFVTMHGFAFNINTDLSYFNLMNPCGFTDKGVTSLAKELSSPVSIDEVKQKLQGHLSKNLNFSLVEFA